MGSTLGMAEPANCTLSPLRTPLLVLLAGPRNSPRPSLGPPVVVFAPTPPAAAAVSGSGASQDAQGSRGGPGRDAGGDVAQQLAGARALEIGQREPIGR